MNSGHSCAALEERRLHARHLVSRLDPAELFVLRGLATGISRKAIAARRLGSSDNMECTVASLMAKLGARTIADAVRIAIYANLSSPIDVGPEFGADSPETICPSPRYRERMGGYCSHHRLGPESE